MSSNPECFPTSNSGTFHQAHRHSRASRSGVDYISEARPPWETNYCSEFVNSLSVLEGCHVCDNSEYTCECSLL